VQHEGPKVAEELETDGIHALLTMLKAFLGVRRRECDRKTYFENKKHAGV
jgi:hypothetical protein